MNFEVDLDNDGKVIDFLTSQLLVKIPEEVVRQKYLKILHYEYNYPKEVMRREVPIWRGSNEALDDEGNPIRADIVVYNNRVACINRDQGQIKFIVECKAPNETRGYNQLVSYIFNTSAQGGVWFNDNSDESTAYFRKIDEALSLWAGIPRYRESWDSVNRRKKDELLPPLDIKGLLKRCHNKLHGRGHEGEEEDLTMDMVRIILAKAQDEENPGNLPDFYCSSEELLSEAGNQIVAGRVQSLFNTVKRLNPDVFTEHEKITVGPRAICAVVVELQQYRLLADIHSDQDWDIMGNAYEQYTATYLKRQQGQFFTNRIVTDFLVKAIDPEYTDIILDPAGGSGGFLTSALRFVRRNILTSEGTQTSKDRRLDQFRTRLFMVDMSPRLVKIAKTAMILNGDGHTGMTQGDSLGEYSNFDTKILAQCSKGIPTVILTNPPFAGTGDGKITDRETLTRFSTGKKWKKIGNEYVATQEINDNGVPPELLFFERSVDWLAPGGKLGIVLPKSFLDTQSYLPGRALLFKQCDLLAVVNLHKNTFQPHTGVRTCLVILQKKNDIEDPETIREIPNRQRELTSKVFMSISRKIGQDSEGVPLYKRDANNQIVDGEIDEDMTSILYAYKNFLENRLQESEFSFAVEREKFITDQNLNINPQKYLPSLNKTLKTVQQIDNVDDWNVTRIGDIEGISIFKGARLKSENLIVDKMTSDSVEKYYTPTAILQEKSDSAKLLDVALATAKQLKTIDGIRVYRGDIVISRSGSIGRVAYITNQFDGVILSDDMIRIRFNEDNDLQYYLYYFLQTEYAQDQMLRNEYGSVQQHLEPEHIRDLLIPIPNDDSQIEEIITSAKQSILKKEELFEKSTETISNMLSKIEILIAQSEENEEIAD